MQKALSNKVFIGLSLCVIYDSLYLTKCMHSCGKLVIYASIVVIISTLIKLLDNIIDAQLLFIIVKCYIFSKYHGDCFIKSSLRAGLSSLEP
jgi:hypothetical protein